MKIILASQSPRRKKLMDLLGVPFEVIVSGIEETILEGLTREEPIRQIAYQKAKAVYNRTKAMGDRIIISSDTMCLKEGKLYGKPKTEQEAIQNFREFSGQEVEILTGLCMLIEKDGAIEEQKECTTAKVTFEKMKEEDIQICLRKENVYDKAGGFDITGFSGIYVTKIEGNMMDVLGLPMNIIYQTLKKYECIDWK